MHSFMVWIINGTTERETVRWEMMRWREPRAIVITLAVIASHMNMRENRTKEGVCVTAMPNKTTSVAAQSSETVVLMCK